MAGPLQAADDMVRIIANGLTFGIADKAAAALGERDTAAKTAAARDRAGVAGDLATVLGYGGGAKLAFQGIKQVPKIAKAVLSKKGAAAAGLGLVGLSEYNSRTGDSKAQAQPANKAAAPAKAAQAKAAPDIDRMAAEIAAALQPAAAESARPSSFDEMVQNLIAEQGGISLRQLNALGEAARSGAAADTARQGEAPKPGNTAASILEQQYIDQYRRALSDPNADPTAAATEFEKKILQLNKSPFIDRYGFQDQQ